MKKFLRLDHVDQHDEHKRTHDRTRGRLGLYRCYRAVDDIGENLQIALAGEMEMLTDQLDRLAQMHRTSRDFTRR